MKMKIMKMMLAGTGGVGFLLVTGETNDLSHQDEGVVLSIEEDW